MRDIYNGKPLKWDRPNEGLYEGGAIRIYDKDAAGNFTMARKATDEEVRFIMMYELIVKGNDTISNKLNTVLREVETVERRVRAIPGSG